MTQVQRNTRRKVRILRHAQETGNVSKTCRFFGISREIFYQWKRSLKQHSEESLINSKPCLENPKVQISPEIEEKVIYLRKTYHLSQLRQFGKHPEEY